MACPTTISRYGRSADGRKTDRYGKKYSWIAFYELAGLRQDKNLLSEYYDDPRISDTDIDPSFPVKQREYNLVEEDFLGDRKISAEEWIFKSDPPDVTPYLKVDCFCGEEGPWILLEGRLSQRDNQVSRDMFTSLQGLIVKSEESQIIVERLKQNKIYAGRMPSCPEDFYTYAGEIPWCDTYPANSWEELLFKNVEETVEVEESEDRTFEILFPVRENTWEDYHSTIVPSRSVATLSRQIADSLSLCGQPQSFDLFEKDGRRASITFRYGEGWGEMQKFTYLREDLLKRYLAEINGELIWVIWGERREVSQNRGAPYKSFQEVKVYCHS